MSLLLEYKNAMTAACSLARIVNILEDNRHTFEIARKNDRWTQRSPLFVLFFLGIHKPYT